MQFYKNIPVICNVTNSWQYQSSQWITLFYGYWIWSFIKSEKFCREQNRTW